MNDTLHVVTMIANPIRWKSRVAIARAAISDWLREPYVHVTIVEAAHGARDYDLADLGEHSNEPDLERMFDNYLRDREEDSNIVG